MLKNITYNLIETISIISKSLYRYDTYIKDASECESCKEIWLTFREQREKELSILIKELKAHIESGELEVD